MSRNDGDSVQVEIDVSKICYELGSVTEQHLRDLEKAAGYYHESTQHDKKNLKASLALAKIQTKRSDFTAAQTQLTSLLQNDDVADEASMILANLMMEQNSFSSAAFHYRQLLEKSGTNYEALAQFIDVCRRMDKLEDVEAVFEIVEKSSKRTKMDAGYIYCQGLYLRYAKLMSDISTKSMIV